MNINQIGNNILVYLREQGKTQVDLANGLGTSKQVVNKIIKGKKAIKTQELVSIADFLNISVEDIINEKCAIPKEELEAVHLYGTIKNNETADLLLSIIDNLSSMEEELGAHGLLK